MIRILVKQGGPFERVDDGMVWHKNGQVWGNVIIQKYIGPPTDATSIVWEDIEVVFEDKT